MFRTRPARFAIVCVALWVLQLALTVAAFYWASGTRAVDESTPWWQGAVLVVALVLGALLFVQLPRALQWRPRLNARPSPELNAERRRIARDLHDTVGSQLVCAMALLDSNPHGGREVLSILERCMLDLRLLVDSMDADGESVTERLARLRHRVQPVLERRGIEMSWDVQDFDGPPQLQGHCAGHLVAIVQEALSNVLQHANASEVAVSVHYLAASGSWYAEVSDNGGGIDPDQHDGLGTGSGIAGMHRRAQLAGGQLSFLPRQGGGTSVWVIVPGGIVLGRGPDDPPAAGHKKSPANAGLEMDP